MANILIVDDSRTSRRVLRTILENNGYDVVGEASNGQEGYDSFKEFSPDIVTMDVTMPVMDGITALKLIMTDSPDAKVIMVTAAGQKSKMVEAIKAGAAEFIQKPFEPEQIISILDNIAVQ